jgi:hypothetical protein
MVIEFVKDDSDADYRELTELERRVVKAALHWRRIYAEVFSFESDDRPEGLTDAEETLGQSVDTFLAARAKNSHER